MSGRPARAIAADSPAGVRSRRSRMAAVVPAASRDRRGAAALYADALVHYVGASRGRLGAAGPGATAFLGEAATRGFEVDRSGTGDLDAFVLIDALDSSDASQVLGDAHRLLKREGTLLVATSAIDGGLSGEWTLNDRLQAAGFHAVEIAQAPAAADGPRVSIALSRAGVRRERPLVSVIVPVYNERSTIVDVLDQLVAKTLDGADKEIIVVESHSTDGSREAVAEFAATHDVHVVWQDSPRGKGSAVRAGLEAATGDIVLIQDADLEYDLADYDRLLEPVRTYRRAFVLGSRHAGSARMRVFTDQWALGAVCNVGHVLLTTLFNFCYRQRLKDPWTMYKVLRRDCLHGLTFECDRFNFDVELVAKLIRKGYTPVELPVRYHSRSFKEGKKIRVMRDPWTWIWACLKYRFVSPYGDE